MKTRGESICQKCDGEGWLWWNELYSYYGPAIETWEDDTKYTCDLCGGTGITIDDDEV